MDDKLTCRKCGTTQDPGAFYKKKGKPDPTWCKECYREWHRQRYTPKTGGDDTPRSCAQCGVSYRPKARRPSVYCSFACKDRARKDRAIDDREIAKPSGRICMHCGLVLSQRVRADAIFCSQKCNYGAHSLQRKLRARTGDEDKPGYLRAFICNRDKWTCGICGEPVDPALRHPDPRCVSLDHVVPVSHGGTNDLWNLRLTHLVCNLKRGNALEAHASL